MLGVFAAVFAGGAVILAQQWVGRQRAALEVERQKIMANYQAPIEVLIAAKDIPEGTVLEASHLQVGTIPERFVQPYAVHPAQAKEAIGKMTAVPIAKDEQLLSTKLRRAEEAPVGSTLSSVTPKGKRAVTIAVDAITGVGGFVRPTDIVDILWTVKMPSAESKEGQVVTVTLFQDVPVLAVGSEFDARQAGRKSASEKTEQGYMVTLALTPQDTSFLLFAREQGRIQLSLRPKAETGSQVVVPASINTLLQMQLGAKGAGQSAPKPARQVEVYKGLKRDVVALSDGEQ